MTRHTQPTIALGMITRHFDDHKTILRFLKNAETYGHVINRVIVAYSHNKDEATVAEVEKRIPIDLLHVSDLHALREQMHQIGLASEAVVDLLVLPDGGESGEVPYGAYRNAVLFKALLDGIDYLLFFDTDVEPRVLTDLEGVDAKWQEADFVGSHMHSLTKEHVSATTSEYSGYYIIPPMSFPGLGELLIGLGKGMAVEYMDDCHEHQCLNLGPDSPGFPRPTEKPLGGNLGLDLRQAERLAPFYSTVYTFDNMTIKGRGEDTLLGQAISASSGQIMDVDVRVFHHTYEGFPAVPDIRKKSIRDRFYWACLGWIGRNPFLSWYLDQTGKLETDLRSETTMQRIGLEIGGEKAAAHLKDPRFKELVAAFEASSQALPDSIERYHRLMRAWRVLLAAIGREQPPRQVEDIDVSDLRLAS
ncbi:MAG: hypothetical protein P1P76_11075 [Anaerolineales bacterium]|nr:hypothetical protein [Anaerolineales bacterium]